MAVTLLAESMIISDRTRRGPVETRRPARQDNSLRKQRQAKPAQDVANGVALALGAAGDLPGLLAITPVGRSMADAWVSEHDVVLVQPADDIRDGELVALRRGPVEPVVLRRIAFEGDHAILRAEDRRGHPTVLPRNRVTVCGRVVAIVRSSPTQE